MKKYMAMAMAMAMAMPMFVAGQVMAAPITYDESVDGDLVEGMSLLRPDSEPGDQYVALLNLGTGANTVQGTASWSNSLINPGDGDMFDFTVASGSVLTSIFLDISLQDVGSGDWSLFYWSLDTDSGSLMQSTAFPTSQSLFDLGMPLTSGLFGIRANGFSGALAGGDFRVADYTLTLNVASVPEPASLALLGLGLAGISFSRKRRQRT